MERDADDIKQRLIARAEDVCRALYPAGKKVRRSGYSVWNIGNLEGAASRKKKGMGSASVRLDNLVGYDFATDDRGDIFTLIGKALGLVDFRAQVKWAKDFLGESAGGEKATRAKTPPPSKEPPRAAEVRFLPPIKEPDPSRLRAEHDRWHDYYSARADGGFDLVLRISRAKPGTTGAAKCMPFVADRSGRAALVSGGLENVLRPLYNLRELLSEERAADEFVIVCEGEKAADAVIDAGLLGTCWQGGINTFEKTDWSPLAGRTVVLWPDNDDEGRRGMGLLAEKLQKFAGRVVILSTADSSGGDKSDAADVDKAAILARADEAERLMQAEDAAASAAEEEKAAAALGDAATGKGKFGALGAEQALAGALLEHWDICVDALAQERLEISPEWFGNRTAKHVVAVALESIRRGVSRDDINRSHIAPVLDLAAKRAGVRPDDEKAMAGILALPGQAATLENIPRYGRWLADLAKTRRRYLFFRECLKKTGEAAAESFSAADAADGVPPSDGVWDDCMSAALQLDEKLTAGFSDFETLDESTTAMMNAVRAARLSGDYSEFDGLLTGIPPLDDATGGLPPGSLTIVGGRPGKGKTQWSLFQALLCFTPPKGADEKTAAAIRRRAAVFFSLEMANKQLATMALSLLSGVEKKQFRKGCKDMTREEWELVEKKAREISSADSPFYMEDIPKISAESIRSRALRLSRRLRREGKTIGLIVVDYLQLVDTGENQNYTRSDEVGKVSRALKELAKELRVPVIACAQLNRKQDDRANAAPKLSDLRESGNIEADADIVLFLDSVREGGSEKQDEWVMLNGKETRLRHLNLYLGKAREGALLADPIAIDFYPGLGRFRARVSGGG